MNNFLVDLILGFAFYSFLGWILESSFKTVRERQIVNSGFLTGPFIPLYGFGAIIVMQTWHLIEPLIASLNLLVVMLIQLVITTTLAGLLEYSTGVLLEAVFQRRWWDYSDERYNIRGLVSFNYSLLWGGLSFMMLDLIQPWLDLRLSIIPMNLKYIALILLLVYLALDLANRMNVLFNSHTHARFTKLQWCYSIVNRRKKMNPKWKAFRRLTDEEQYELYIEYASYIDELVFHPTVQTMKDFRHHVNVSCFEHSLSVSFASYLLCKKMGWDSKSAARGGLLHDLFLYDWRTTDLDFGKHGFVHPRIAYENAVREFSLNNLEKDIILKHMFPLTWNPPTYRESFLVCVVDKLCALQELLGVSTAAGSSLSFAGLMATRS